VLFDDRPLAAPAVDSLKQGIEGGSCQTYSDCDIMVTISAGRISLVQMSLRPNTAHVQMVRRRGSRSILGATVLSSRNEGALHSGRDSENRQPGQLRRYLGGNLARLSRKLAAKNTARSMEPICRGASAVGSKCSKHQKLLHATQDDSCSARRVSRATKTG
jgi:hypothetical protein